MRTSKCICGCQIKKPKLPAKRVKIAQYYINLMRQILKTKRAHG